MRGFGDGLRGARRLAAGICASLLLSAPAAALAAVAALAAQGAQGSPPGGALDQLMKLLAQRRQGEVHYVETDHLAILDQPVRSSGVLVYEAPDHLEKRTLEPRRESLVLQGDELTVERGRRRYRVQLSAYPKLAPFVDAVRDTLAGNEAALEKVFEVRFTGTLADWTLQLVPLDEDAARAVRQVTITGARDAIHTVEILQVDGDRSVMTLGPPADASAAGPGKAGEPR
jgi:Outer membrane lipoprotein carrier protein LolA-like